MRLLALISALLLVSLPLLGQESRGNIYDAHYKYDKALRQIQGVKDVTVGGLDGELKIIIRVETEDARQAITRLVGTKLDGFPTHILGGNAKSQPKEKETEPTPTPTSTTSCSSCACPCHKKVGQTVAEVRKPEGKFDLDRIDDKEYEAEQCDMLREILGLAKRDAKNGIRCQQMIGWTNDPDKIAWVKKAGIPWWRSKEMPGLPGSNQDVICYTYIKHRQFCPRGMKSLLEDLEKLNPDTNK